MSNSLDNLAQIANISHELLVLHNQMDLPQEESPPTTKSGKPKKISCIECRQQKSKCDAHEKHPNPCTRCLKKNLKCDIRSDYKRTYKRARIAQIEREFTELKKTLTASQAAELLRRIPTLSHRQFQGLHREMANERGSEPYPVEGYNTHSMNAVGQVNALGPAVPGPDLVGAPPQLSDQMDPIDPRALECTEKSVDEITLSPETISLLYLEYVRHYHPILPVVDVAKGPERIYRLCPALFWVIMFVSLRRCNNGSASPLLITLAPIIKEILSEITISPITRYNPTEEDEPIINACLVYSVQAFLIHTFWPPVISSLSADSSWNTIGVALFQAIRIGLHLPGLLSDSVNGSKTPQQLAMSQELAKTWIICNIVSQSIASSFGFPAFVQFDATLWALRPGSSIQIPSQIQCMMEIAHFEDQLSKILNSNTLDPYGLMNATERLPLIKVLSRQLDELEIKLTLATPNDGFKKFQLLTARVHLLTYYFMDTAKMPEFELTKGLVSLYNAAIALINHAQISQAKDQLFVRYLPVVYIINIWQASCIIAKLTHSDLKDVIDVQAGRQSYMAAISLASKGSILKHDIAYRSSGIMRNMWQLFRTLEEKHLISYNISIRSRMSASVFFDCLYLLRDQVGMIKLNTRTDENENNEEEDDEDDNDNDEEVLESEPEDHGSVNSTPTSASGSSRSKKRTLSNTVNAESKARRIIRTIPLDPQPISAPHKRSNIFKVVNNSTDSSPQVKSEGSPSVNGTPQQIESQTPVQPLRMNISGNAINRTTSKLTTSFNPDMVLYESPTQPLENLEIDNYDINSDLLWKDVDSVMNEFGFHTQ